MASTRVRRMSSPLGLGSSRFSNSACSSMVSRSMAQMCLSKAGLRSKNMSTGGGDEKKMAVNAGGGSCGDIRTKDGERAGFGCVNSKYFECNFAVVDYDY